VVAVICLEWIHTKAALGRWSEEISLLREDIRWICVSFSTTAVLWQARRGTDGESLSRGFKAYCQKQAKVYEKLAHIAKEVFDVL
jgi:hypothetical protein